MFVVNYNVNLVNVFVIVKFCELGIFGKIGLSFVYGLSYFIDVNLVNVLVFENFEEFNVYFWMDVYIWGEYLIVIWNWLEEYGFVLEILLGDMEFLKKGKFDFMGVNYYCLMIYVFNGKDGVGFGKMNIIGEKGIFEEIGVLGLYKNINNLYLEKMNWDWDIDLIGLCIGLCRIINCYKLLIMIIENGFGEYDSLMEDYKIYDEY